MTTHRHAYVNMGGNITEAKQMFHKLGKCVCGYGKGKDMLGGDAEKIKFRIWGICKGGVYGVWD